jgi:hypothetical protein
MGFSGCDKNGEPKVLVGYTDICTTEENAVGGCETQAFEGTPDIFEGFVGEDQKIRGLKLTMKDLSSVSLGSTSNLDSQGELEIIGYGMGFQYDNSGTMQYL